MAVFTGTGQFEQYSKTVKLATPVRVEDLGELLGMPEDLADNLIAVRDNRKLNANDLINDNENITLFLAVMGG